VYFHPKEQNFHFRHKMKLQYFNYLNHKGHMIIVINRHQLKRCFNLDLTYQLPVNIYYLPKPVSHYLNI
jgi:hypothetical protein